ncbi:hypothetical protein QYE76_035767 [Lolium multiflorum]|uniref:NB-ARC domain-containing protein n=1 Tax=Lolium multiflorum TaxID=4521 RepID=A0AAD8VMH0_LOLMU|nr:hypothetical protein QYE76_035767 [Lolium multiflorum]
MSKVKLKKKLDTIEEIINDACKILELMTLPSISGANQSHGVAANSQGSVTTSTSLSEIIGRDEDCDKIVAMLHEKEEHGQPDTNSAPCYSVVGIHGVSGSGKTALAQLVCAREKKDAHFDLVMWVYVTQEYCVDNLYVQMFEAATLTSCPQLSNRDTLQRILEEKLHGKRFLLVLDDVWYNIRDVMRCESLQQILSPLQAGEAGSKILVTSRTEDALLALGATKKRCIPIPVLDENVFCNLLMYYALHGVPADDHARSTLGDIGKEIAKKLKGSPLAATIVGRQLHMRQNVEDWRSVRDRNLLNETMGALWWSYHHLRDQVKRCFAFCSIFPRGHLLERHELVNLWVAEGFARLTSEGEDMEDVCREYFDELVSASFLQLKAKENSREKDYYLVHDLLHDLAEKAAGSDCFRIEYSLKLQGKYLAVEVPPNVRHIFVPIYDEELITKKICQLDNLRTLIIGSLYNLEIVGDQVLKCIFKRLRMLRVLTISAKDFIGSDVPSDVRVPACIGQLRHLRYLAFQPVSYQASGRRMILPATFAKLCHMQILDFGWIKKVVFSSCEHICSLVNLRHVICVRDVDLGSISNLTSLRTMAAFNVKREQGHELKQLGNLNKLRGQLLISGLEKVESKAEALEANLASKEGLSTLELSWGWDDEASPEVQAEVLEGLCPPKDLKSLIIKSYEGLRYPSWMHNGGPKHVNHLKLMRCSPQPGPELGVFCAHLRELRIQFCDWHALPDYMEHLKSLQTLHIKSCKNIRLLPALPQSLELLDLTGCNEVSLGSCCMERLTSLQTLMISSCNGIRSLPTLPQSIKDFKLRTDSEVLLSSCRTAGDPYWQKIKHIPYVSICKSSNNNMEIERTAMKMGVVQDQKEARKIVVRHLFLLRPTV